MGDVNVDVDVVNAGCLAEFVDATYIVDDVFLTLFYGEPQ